MSNTDAAHRLNQQREKCQHFWMSAHGTALLNAQRACIGPVIDSHHQGHALEIAMGPSMLQASSVGHVIQWAPSLTTNQPPETLICPLDDLALPDGCLDITLIHHWMEHTDNAHQLLQEAARVTCDQGILLIVGFNPYSLTHLPRHLMPGRSEFPNKQPHQACWRSPRYVRDWLSLVDFEIQRIDYCGFRIPLLRPNDAGCSGALETLGRRHNLPLGDCYMLQAKRRQQPASTKRITFGMPVVPGRHSVQAFSRGDGSSVTLRGLAGYKRYPDKMPEPELKADFKITSVSNIRSDTPEEHKR